MSLEKFDGVKPEFKAESERLLVKHPRPARDHSLETWQGAGDFETRSDSGQVEGLEAKKSIKAEVNK